MVQRGEADSMICGTFGQYLWHLNYVTQVLGDKKLHPVGALSLMILEDGPLFVADTQVHPIAAEDSAIGLVRYANGAIGQFEVSWAFRGGMDLRDEVSGTEGTIWLNHYLRTGFEMFTTGGAGGSTARRSTRTGAIC